MTADLILEDKSQFEGISFGGSKSIAGEVVFSTGMMGYPESLTDPSYKGQILVLTYPLVGNYGVPEKKYWESDRIMVSGLVVSNYIDTPSHIQNQKTLAEWFREENVPLLEIKDTRLLTQKTRDRGSMLGKILFDKKIDWYDPNNDNLVASVSISKITVQTPPRLNLQTDRKSKPFQGSTLKSHKNKTILLIDCGAKFNIQRALLKRGITVITVPWDYTPFDYSNNRRDSIDRFDGIIISNGPGDPKMADKTIQTIQKSLENNIPTLGICLGHQLLSLAGGGDTKKLKFGHRSQNQPCIMNESKRCYITTQNHGFAVDKIPSGFKSWFTNANDNSNEGIIHTKKPFMSVQFHPEATPGPTDTEWIFDCFLERIS